MIKYSDVIVITGSMSALNSIVLMAKLFKKPYSFETPFFNDNPLKKIEDDILGYKNYAKNVAESINNSKFEKAFAIGITSKWGGGKTSFLTMIEESLNKDIIRIDFNPWRSTNSKSIIKDFFQTIKESFSRYSSNLSNLLVDYGDRILELDDNIITKGSKLFFSSHKDDSLNALFEQINLTIKKLNKNLVIFIDDVDRLDKNEVFEVIRLIRNTANFPNTCFVVAYDRAYVLNTLKEMKIHNHEVFLEKIFQLEVTLPYFDKTILVDSFIKNMKSVFLQLDEGDLENIVLKKNGDTVLFLDWVETIRDVIRLSNSIMVNAKHLVNEIDPVDFVSIEILRLKYPSVYEVFFRKEDIFLTTKYSSQKGHDILTLKPISANVSKSELERYLDENISSLSIEKSDVSKIVAFIEDIFSDKTRISFSNNYVKQGHLSIVNAERFHLYFAYDLIPGILSEEAFLNTIKKPKEEIEKEIDKWIEGKLEVIAKSRFVKLHPTEIPNKKCYENVMQSIVYFSNKESGLSERGSKVNYDHHDFFNKIINGKFFYEKDEEQNEPEKNFNNFVVSLFNINNSSYIFEAGFLKFISPYSDPSNGHLGISPILCAADIEKCAVKYFAICCEIEYDYNNSLLYYWGCCNIPSLVRLLHPTVTIHRSVIFPEAQSIFENFLSDKGLNTFLYFTIMIDRTEGITYQVKNVINEMFESGGFLPFLENQDEMKWSYLKEYKDFFAKAMEAGTNFIDYNFKVIPLPLDF